MSGKPIDEVALTTVRFLDGGVVQMDRADYDRLTAAQQQGGVDLGEVVCLACGDPIMPMGQFCHACSHPVSAPPSAPVGAAEDMVLDAIERRESSAPVGVGWPLSLLRAEHWREVYIGHRCMRLEVTYDYATWERLMAEIESALAQQPAADCTCPHQDAREPDHDVACPARLAQQPAAVDGVRGLVAKWREEATAYVVRANEKDKSGGFRWAGWMRDELRSKAGVCKRHADELESALAAQPGGSDNDR